MYGVNLLILVEVVKSLLTPPKTPDPQTKVLSDEEVKKQFPKLPAGTIVQQKPNVLLLPTDESR